jgi:molybdopterin-guanine dinucleotide biosynthesis protein A
MTLTKKHHKHPPLLKPSTGEWGRNEVGILGAPCDMIKQLADSITRDLGSSWKTCYVDADHSAVDFDQTEMSGAALFTDKIHSRRIDFLGQPSRFQRKAMLNDYDVLLVNGNHFTANTQIVILHSKKLESLQRKTDRLTNVIGVVETDVTLDSCAFLAPYLSADTRVFTQEDQRIFLSWFESRITAPAIRGLVLAGGKSMRMGSDKSSIAYHGIPQRQFVRNLLEGAGLNTFVSCRQDQADALQNEGSVIQDRYLELGPFGAILSAMMSAPDCAWLVIATDLPLINEETLQQLIRERDPSKIATAFYNPETKFPEPLITLWEPKAYAILLSFLAQGIACPRKVLINSEVHLVKPTHPVWLTNVNTPDEALAIRNALVEDQAE